MTSSNRTNNSVCGIIFDISGTVMDFGSRGPVAAFVEVFRRHGVEISETEARGPMGLHKRDHIAGILALPEVAARWEQAHGRKAAESDVENLFQHFTPLQVEVLDGYLEILPGVPELAAELTRRGIPFANTTGFDSWMMKSLIAAAEQQGYRPVCWMTPDQAGGGRPAPWMVYEAAKRMGAYPLRRMVKVGDTPADIAEAQAAGMWAVAVVQHGNEVGLSRAALAALNPAERENRFAAARAKLRGLGAHYVLEQTADLLGVLGDIEERIGRGERP
ncbi:MAG: phosphonoacetaldehyde hydrolase [Bryobacter sp.]|nr:phosphonoacetaldehyde hydrolase [Bryobacter sp.]